MLFRRASCYPYKLGAQFIVVVVPQDATASGTSIDEVPDFANSRLKDCVRGVCVHFRETLCAYPPIPSQLLQGREAQSPFPR